MPQVRMFNPAGREVFPPKPVNVDNDPERPRLRIVIVPPGNFLAKEGMEGAAGGVEGTEAVPTIVGGIIPIAADDALHIPAFYDSSAFPEPEVPEVADEPPTVATSLDDSDGVSDATGVGIPHVMTEAERQALEAEYERLVAARNERLKGVNNVAFEGPLEPEIVRNDPVPLVHTPKFKRPKRKVDDIMAELMEAMEDESE